jgi:hypothetical protein
MRSVVRDRSHCPGRRGRADRVGSFDGSFFDEDLEDAENRPSTFAELLRRKLAEYDDTLATPGQARDIAERDLLDDVRNILSEESEEAQS